MQYLPTWQYARFLLPANPIDFTGTLLSGSWSWSEESSMIRPTRLGIVLFLPSRNVGIWAAFTALVWEPILNAGVKGFIPAVFLVMSPAWLLEGVPDRRSTLRSKSRSHCTRYRVVGDIISIWTDLVLWDKSCFGGHCISERGPNIITQRLPHKKYLCISGCGVWDICLRYPAYRNWWLSNQASGPPLTRIS